MIRSRRPQAPYYRAAFIAECMTQVLGCLTPITPLASKHAHLVRDLGRNSGAIERRIK